MTAQSPIRSEVHFEGRVQGVGFRFTTENAARGYDVTGYVRNLPDGRVELVAEGSRAEVDRFLAEVSSRMEGYIHNQLRRDLPATGELTRFEVRHP